MRFCREEGGEAEQSTPSTTQSQRTARAVTKTKADSLIQLKASGRVRFQCGWSTPTAGLPARVSSCVPATAGGVTASDKSLSVTRVGPRNCDGSSVRVAAEKHKCRAGPQRQRVWADAVASDGQGAPRFTGSEQAAGHIG